MPAETASLRGGDLNAAVTSAVVGIQNKYLGRGPKSASTFYKDNVMVTLLYDVMTKAEQSLAAAAHEDAVTHMRHLFQKDDAGRVHRGRRAPHRREGPRVHQRQQH